MIQLAIRSINRSFFFFLEIMTRPQKCKRGLKQKAFAASLTLSSGIHDPTAEMQKGIETLRLGPMGIGVLLAI